MRDLDLRAAVGLDCEDVVVADGDVAQGVVEEFGEIRRVLATELTHPERQDVLYPAGTLLDEDAVDTIDSLGIDEVKVRTASSSSSVPAA